MIRMTNAQLHRQGVGETGGDDRQYWWRGEADEGKVEISGLENKAIAAVLDS